MEFIDYTTNWVKGEVFQGKVMLFIGALVLIAGVAILRGDNSFLRGMLIPMGLVAFALIGYGGFQVVGRPAHLDKVSKIYQESPQKAVEQEYKKAKKDDKTYKNLRVVWAILIIVSAVLYLVVSKDYHKGLSVGLVGMFLSTLLLDSTLHNRLTIYLEGIEKFLS